MTDKPLLQDVINTHALREAGMVGDAVVAFMLEMSIEDRAKAILEATPNTDALAKLSRLVFEGYRERKEADRT